MLSQVLLVCLFLVVAGNAASLRNGRYQGEIVFIGDSITQFWANDGQFVWNEHFAPLGAVNVGVSGDVTQQTIDRIIGGSIDNLNSRLAVLLIGTNDLSYNQPETYVADQIARIISFIKANLPGVKVLLLGILPRGDGFDGINHQKARNVNELIKNLDDGRSVRFLNMENQFSTSLGYVIPEYYWQDWLHLSAQGYQAWQRTMAPLFNQMLNEP